jgi:hypothetical protein
MVFYIKVYFQDKDYRLKVELIRSTNQIEQYRVIARNRQLVFQCDRPFLKAKNFKNKKPKWQLIEGNVLYNGLYERIVEEIESYLKEKEDPSPYSRR